ECYVGHHDMQLDANHFHFHFWRRIGRDFYEQQVDADRVERAIGQLREWFRLPEHEDAIISLEVPTQAGMERLDVARSQLIRLFCAALMGLTIHATNIYPEPVLDFMHEVQPTPAIAILNTGVWPV